MTFLTTLYYTFAVLVPKAFFLVAYVLATMLVLEGVRLVCVDQERRQGEKVLDVYLGAEERGKEGIQDRRVKDIDRRRRISRPERSATIKVALGAEQEGISATKRVRMPPYVSVPLVGEDRIEHADVYLQSIPQQLPKSQPRPRDRDQEHTRSSSRKHTNVIRSSSSSSPDAQPRRKRSETTSSSSPAAKVRRKRADSGTAAMAYERRTPSPASSLEEFTRGEGSPKVRPKTSTRRSREAKMGGWGAVSF